MQHATGTMRALVVFLTTFNRNSVMKRRARHVLLVEDNEGDIELLERALATLKVRCSLSVALNGEEALEHLHQTGRHAGALRPDLILLDINMPAMNGVHFLQSAKSDPQFSMIPIVMLTSSSAKSDVMACYQSHVNCYVQKPFDAHDYIQVLRHLLIFWLDAAVILPPR